MSGAPVAKSPPTTIDLDTHEDITVLGRRPYTLAPLPGYDDPPPGRTGFAPGGRLGPFEIAGGPTDRLGSSGVAAGLMLPIRGVKGLSFGLIGTAGRGAAPVGSRAGAGILVGFMLKF